MRLIKFIILLHCGLFTVCGQSQSERYPYPVEVWQTHFDMSSQRTQITYQSTGPASKKWKICVSFPHMKDSYWLAVNYGIAEEARQLGVTMNLYQASGYEHLKIQKEQIRKCVAEGAMGVIIGAISQDGLNDLVAELAGKGIPVVDVINGMSSRKMAAKSLVSFGEMGLKAGQYIAARHPAGGKPVKIAWFPGPKAAAWVKAGNAGFRRGIQGSSARITAVKYGDTGHNLQGRLLQEVLKEQPDISYIAGTAVTAEAAVKILKARGLERNIKVVSYYLTPGVYHGIRKGQIMASPTDSAVIQGRIAMDQMVRILEKREYHKHVGPVIKLIDARTGKTFDQSTSLAPEGFAPVYKVD